MRVIVDESAWRDLENIALHIAADNPPAARAQIKKIPDSPASSTEAAIDW